MFWFRNLLKPSNLLLVVPKQPIKPSCNISTTYSLYKIDANVLNSFDRNTKSLQRQSAAVAEDVNVYDYLKDEIGYRLADRVFDIKRKFKVLADIGEK